MICFRKPSDIFYHPPACVTAGNWCNTWVFARNKLHFNKWPFQIQPPLDLPQPLPFQPPLLPTWVKRPFRWLSTIQYIRAQLFYLIISEFLVESNRKLSRHSRPRNVKSQRNSNSMVWLFLGLWMTGSHMSTPPHLYFHSLKECYWYKHMRSFHFVKIHRGGMQWKMKRTHIAVPTENLKHANCSVLILVNQRQTASEFSTVPIITAFE